MLTYEEICENFNEIMAVLKKDSYENVFNQKEKTVVRREQASGGTCMQRGYYCPSFVMDIVLGNVNRGRLIKRLRTFIELVNMFLITNWLIYIRIFLYINIIGINERKL